MFLKISLTGMIVCFICLGVIGCDGRRAELAPAWKVNVFSGGGILGLLATVIGFLGHIWSN